MLKKIIFFLVPVLSLFAQVGIPFGKIKADLSVPLIFPSTKETSSSQFPDYGDKYFAQFAFPYNLEATLGYALSIDKNNSLLGFWRLKYGDDPFNSIFTHNDEAQGGAPTFTRQSINNLISFKVINKFRRFSLSTTAFAVFDLSREVRTEDFVDGVQNNYSYNLSIRMDFPLPRGIILSPNVSYGYNQFPNDFTPIPAALVSSILPTANISSGGIFEIREDYHKVGVGLASGFPILNNLRLNLNYAFSADFYVENPVPNFSVNGGYSDVNKRNFKNNLSLDLFANFLPQANYYFFNLRLSYLFRNNDSNFVRVLSTTSDFVTRLSSDDKTIILQPLPGFNIILADDYEDFIFNLIGLYPTIKFHRQYSFTLGYSFSIKNYINNFALFGNEEEPGVDSGTYKAEERFDINHNLFVSFLIQSRDRSVNFTPYFGFQFSSSNNFGSGLNRDVYYLGMVTSYEF